MRGISWFVAWCLVGTAYALAAAGALTIGIFVLPVAIAATVALALVRRSWIGLPGLIAGPAVLLGYLAYLNRGGPGDVCVSDAVSRSCTEQYSPWPFAVIGSALAIGSLALFALVGRKPRDAR
ncbi:hypothetical protein F4553_001850 [Allocatelliglobosispora scoriae]|uniref:Uncharacterized protein n=1 Tax=Allocatelliglobosispora scoriae TaxID=643052 RepID=A0A841BNS0_9ACTN|nr:hypothetical protein [Allocatelliglobosispora scoriae]MBB5868471.1 hypothetical protein [Allocatelliglobosispora scoriae]